MSTKAETSSTNTIRSDHNQVCLPLVLGSWDYTVTLLWSCSSSEAPRRSRVEDHAKGDTDGARWRPKWSKQQLCISVLTLCHKLWRGLLRVSTGFPMSRRAATVFSLSFWRTGPREFREKKKSSPYKNYYRTITDTWHPLLVDGSQK